MRLAVSVCMTSTAGTVAAASLALLSLKDEDEFANTASAGSVIAFGLNHEDLVAGDVGVLCSFGAGYSIGSLVIRKR